MEISEFKDVENPDDVISEIDLSTIINAKCGHSFHLKTMKSCISPLHSEYEFYLITGEQCECRTNPYLLVNSPGNKTIPEGLKKLFE